MRILHIGKYYPPDKGGIETATKTIIDYLWNQNILCDLVCFSSTESKITNFENGSIYKFKPLIKLLSTPFSLGYLFFLIKNIRQYQVVHLHTPNPISLFALFLVKSNQKVIIHWHSDTINQKKAYLLYFPFEKIMLKRADYIIVGTEEYFKESIPLRSFASKIKFIPYATNDPNIEKKQHTKEKTTVLAVGRLVKYKGFEFLVQAASMIESNIRIILIGNGPEYIKLENFIKENNLQNFQIKNSIDDLNPYFLEADIFCLPSISRAESFGISLIEAMSFKLPLITTDNKGSGMNFINISQQTGLVIKKECPLELAKAINMLAKSPEMRSDFSRNSYKRFLNNFEYNSVMPKFLEIYK